MRELFIEVALGFGHFILVLVGIFSFCVATWLVLVLLLAMPGKYACSTEASSFENRYLVPTATCQVKVNDKWTNWRNYSPILIDEEEK